MAGGMQLWTTGPACMFTNFGTGIVFLGTAQSAPDIEIAPSFTGVMNDISGQSYPMDRQYDGTEATIAAVLTRWNFSAILAMMNRPFSSALQGGFGAPFPPGGANNFFDTGTLMGQEGATFPLWIWFPKAPIGSGGANPSNAYATMVPGYRFWSTFLIGPERISPGSKAMTQSVIFQAQRAFTTFAAPNPGNIYNGGVGSIFALYDNNMTGISAALIT